MQVGRHFLICKEGNEIDVVTEKELISGVTHRPLAGRRQIFTSEREITEKNIIEVLNKAFVKHAQNAAEIKYLFDYYKGIQPILKRTKEVRPEINNRVVENHAAEIVSFKTGYVFGSPIQYVSRGNVDIHTQSKNGIVALNEMMFEENKAAKDKELGETLLICGIGYRIAFPKRDKHDSLAPFDILQPYPGNCFVVYQNDIYRRPALNVTYIVDEDTGKTFIRAYTDKKVFTLSGTEYGVSELIAAVDNGIGALPVVEYINNSARMGCFENVIPLLDAINISTSDRINDISQFVQNLIWFHNVDIDENSFERLRQSGGIKTKSPAGNAQAIIKFLTSQLDQNGAQTVKDDLYKTVLQIAGVPDRNASTGGNTGQAILLASGWQTAESHARETELTFIGSEKEFLRLVLKIISNCRDISKELQGLALSDIGVKFSRNRTDNMLTKTQGLLNMLEAGIAPETAIANCEMFSDPAQVAADSRRFMEKWLEQRQTQANNNPQKI